MSPTDLSQSLELPLPISESWHDSISSIRKRVQRACDRCRIKKARCDGLSPCSRCRADDVVCCLRKGKSLRRRNYPKGYTEMLERQQSQLVSCIQQLYQRLNKAELWEESMPDRPDDRPLTHDILAAMDLLEPKDDGSGDMETFGDTLELLTSSHEAPTADGVPDPHGQQDSSRGNSPIWQPKNDTPVCLGTPALANHSPAFNTSSSSVDQTITWPPGQPRHPYLPVQATQAHPPLAEAPCAYNGLSRRQYTARDSVGDIDDSSLFGAQPSDCAMHQWIFPQQDLLEPNKISANVRAPPVISPQLEIGQDRFGNGISFDSSDFFTDFLELSPLNAPQTYFQNLSQTLA